MLQPVCVYHPLVKYARIRAWLNPACGGASREEHFFQQLSSAVVENGSVMDIVAADPPAKDDNRATWTRHADLDRVFI